MNEQIMYAFFAGFLVFLGMILEDGFRGVRRWSNAIDRLASKIRMRKVKHANKKLVGFIRYFDKKTKEGLGCELPDGTILLADNTKKSLRVAFPRSKFEKLFMRQIRQRRKYIEVEFTKEEIEIWMASWR